MLNLQEFIAKREAKKRAIEFVREASFVNATPVFFMESEDEDWEIQAAKRVKDIMEKELKAALPFTIAAEPREKDKRLICLVVYATENTRNGYYVYGCSAWIKIRGKWKTYYRSNRKWQQKKNSPGDDLQITYCGCFGDVSTWHGTSQNLKEYFYTY